MDAERWQQVERIFNDALELEPQARAAYLERECDGDVWLQKRIQALFIADDRAGSFLESPAVARLPGQFVGRSLGQYEVRQHLGSGGMGDVYRARDAKLKRDVALKFLPSEFSQDSHRVARFQREAVALAALNHPNIAAIYDLEEIDGAQFLVLEYVEGETLAARLKRGAMSVDRALPIFMQVAEALDAAHAKGVQHRDLKPENIQITRDDRVKLLDFGLAKILAPDDERRTSPDSTGMTQWETTPGVIFGTAPYLTPEQVRGQQPDKRSDIWSFGCVLFEALTGAKAFPGETIADVFAAILKNEPDWTLLPKRIPPSLSELMRRCLQKDPRQRLHDIADARIVLDELVSRRTVARPAPPQTKRLIWVSAVAIVAAILGATVTWSLLSKLPPNESNGALKFSGPTSSFAITLPPGQGISRTLMSAITISPDGGEIIYVSNDRLYRRPLSGMASLIPGTNTALAPEFSPDGRWVAFWMRADRTIKKMTVDGGTLISLAPAMIAPSSLNWSGGAILYVAPTGIHSVSADGGAPELLVRAEPGETLNNPQSLDGGNAILFSRTTGSGMDRWDTAEIVLLSRRTGERKVLIRGGSDGRYIPTGHIVYVVGETLFAVPFDLRRRQVTGSPAAVLDGVMHNLWPAEQWPFGTAQFDYASTGTLIYIPRSLQTTNPPPANNEFQVVLNWFEELKRRSR